MRPALFSYLSMAVSVCAVLSCNSDKLEQPVEIRAIAFGYMADNSDASERFEDSRFSDSMFSAFNSQSTIDAAREYRGHGFDVETSRFNYASEATFTLKTVPENAMVKSLRVSSSDKDVIEILKVSGRDVTVRIHDVGEAILSVSVDGAQNSVSEDYPVRVVSPVNIDFFVTPYWWGKVHTRIRMRASSLPLGLRSCATTVQDSVSVVGYCEYYDLRKYGRTPHVKRDTIRFPMMEQTCLVKKNKKRHVRNITSAIREIRNDWYVTGSRIEVDPTATGYRDTVPHRYGFVVEQVILDFNVFGANPYYEYYFTSKYDRTTDVIVVDEETGEPTGEIGDGGTDGEEDYDETLDGTSIKREESAFFVIRLNSFMSQSVRDSLSRDFSRKLDAVGYDDSRLTDEEKEQRLADIDSHKHDDEK